MGNRIVIIKISKDLAKDPARLSRDKVSKIGLFIDQELKEN